MITELPPKIERLLFSQRLIKNTVELFESFQMSEVEGCVLWYGYVLNGGDCLATTCVRPRQQGHRTNYSVSADGVRAVRREVRRHGMLLLLQIHTHPREAFFSEWDELNALNKGQGALNMVVPHFGNECWINPASFCVVERIDKEWRSWGAADWQRLHLIPDQMLLEHGS